MNGFCLIWAWQKIEEFEAFLTHITTPQKPHFHKAETKIFLKMCFKIFKNDLNVIFLNFEFSSKSLNF